MLTLFSYPPCGTCKKAKNWLDANEISYQERHIVNDPPTRKELQEIKALSGLEWKKLFNTSGKKYRELGLKDKLPDASEDTIIDWLASDGMLIKRPIVTDGHAATVGFKEDEFEKYWKQYLGNVSPDILGKW
ncbi:arsenate reductase [Geomicrobium sp. JCM 19037]|uniref:arsenate reductase family protein n=1 Tax=unclassified Geomicrobium TaxID=2628951 RepID=UPI00045F3C5D|nr:arsenate reductase family protein [Geomicrobium sp. JCM 19037]GAK04224.1 arsenate reductase [Geomicrobium sp. JCM 19037]